MSDTIKTRQAIERAPNIFFLQLMAKIAKGEKKNHPEGGTLALARKDHPAAICKYCLRNALRDLEEGFNIPATPATPTFGFTEFKRADKSVLSVKDKLVGMRAALSILDRARTDVTIEAQKQNRGGSLVACRPWNYLYHATQYIEKAILALAPNEYDDVFEVSAGDRK